MAGKSGNVQPKGKKMDNTSLLVELWRGDVLESVHAGDAVVCDASGAVVWAFDNPQKTILPRSSCKMLQALPLIESGAAAARGLDTRHLALACASHSGERQHVDLVTGWLSQIGMAESDLRCGAQWSEDHDYHIELACAGGHEDQRHNNCSGKHTGFLTLCDHLKAGPEYIDLDHPVQKAVKLAFEEMTGEASPGYAIDGCSAPNFACSLKGLATAMARMADPAALPPARRDAAARLSAAMAAHPELVAGTGRSETELMAAMTGPTAIKHGAEGVFTAILPQRGLGVALKVADGANRAAEIAMAALLVRLGAADRDHPMVAKWLRPGLQSRRGIPSGFLRPSQALFEDGRLI